MKTKSKLSHEITVESDKIKWDQVHSQLRHARQMIKKGGSLTPGEQKKLLQARALSLAASPAEDDTASELFEMLEFQLGKESYGLESTYIKAVVPLRDFTPIPGTPDYILGLTIVRGSIYSVLELKKLFHLPDSGLTDLNKLILIQFGDLEFGIITDRIIGVKHIKKNDIRSSGRKQSNIAGKYITGVTAGYVIIINAEKLLRDYGKIEQEENENIQ